MKKACSKLVKSSRISLVLVSLLFMATTAFAAKVATVDIPVNTQLYATTPAPLTPADCAQCHTAVFGSLKESGANHRFDCQNCHKAIHSYSPKKANYDELMPKCASCHTDIHGPQNKDCSSCHSNAHTPNKVAMSDRLINTCATCHAGPKEELVKFPSKHSLVACNKCHTYHGFKPECSMCHKPHYQGQAYDTCLKCHPVHQPKNVTYPTTEPPQTCGSCHKEVFQKWSKTPSRHSKVNCAVCHKAKHKYIPQCTECHKNPHPAGILAKYPKCLTCHIDVHDLPSMK
jgi:predicted CXXCH cytochrome family protein